MIRRLIKSDIENIVNLELSTINTTLGKEHFEQALLNDLEYVFILEEDNNIIAYISTTFDSQIVEILNICVANDYQNKKYGRLLFEYVLNYFKENNASSAILEVRSSNKRAIHFYELFDFKLVHIRKGYYTNEDALVYQKIF